MSGDAPDTGFGFAVAGAGDVNGDGFDDVLAAAPEANQGQGRVNLFLGSAQGLPNEPDWKMDGERGGDRFGFAVAGVGDVNRDGFADFMVVAAGPPGPHEQPRQGGTAYLFLGAAKGVGASPARTWRTPEWGPVILKAGPVGDVNGDGFADVYLCGDLSMAAGSGTNRCTVMVFHGSPQGPSMFPDWTVMSYLKLDTFGDAVAPAGDVNGDGYGDLLIGAGGDDTRYINGGCAYLYYGAARGLSPAPNWTAHYPFPVRKDVDAMGDMQFGKAACGAGDVNGDGFADILVGARYASRGDLMEGLAFAYYGSPHGLPAEPSWWAESNQAKSSFGSAVAGVGDVNGDGFADVIVGAPTATDNQWGEGAVVVFLGSKAGLLRKQHWSLESDHDREELGSVLAGAGDVNGDGYADVLLGSPNYTADGYRFGSVMVYFGSAEGLRGSFEWRIEKPWLIAIQQEWDHLVIKRQTGWAYAALAVLALTWAVGLGLWRRWNRLTRDRLQRQAICGERARLAQDLHDEVGAHLNRLRSLGHPAGLPTNSAALEAWRAEWEAASVALANALDHIVWRLQPGDHSLERITALICRHAEQTLDAARIPLRIELPPELPQAVVEEVPRDHLVRAVKEALTNLIRHSRATEAYLKVAPDTNTVTFVVADNGCGLVPRAAQDGGDGLANMQRRMKLAGGGFQLHSQPGRGVRVELTVPVCPMCP